jgi:hypothetical protein
MGFVDRPWVLGGEVKIDSAIGRIFGLIWLAALVGFVAAGVGVFLQRDWWSSLALAGSIASLVAILPWWNTVTPSARFWPVAVDVAVLIALLGPWRDQLARLVG